MSDPASSQANAGAAEHQVIDITDDEVQARQLVLGSAEEQDALLADMRPASERIEEFETEYENLQNARMDRAILNNQLDKVRADESRALADQAARKRDLALDNKILTNKILRRMLTQAYKCEIEVIAEHYQPRETSLAMFDPHRTINDFAAFQHDTQIDLHEIKKTWGKPFVVMLSTLISFLIHSHVDENDAREADRHARADDILRIRDGFLDHCTSILTQSVIGRLAEWTSDSRISHLYADTGRVLWKLLSDPSKFDANDFFNAMKVKPKKDDTERLQDALNELHEQLIVEYEAEEKKRRDKEAAEAAAAAAEQERERLEQEAAEQQRALENGPDSDAVQQAADGGAVQPGDKASAEGAGAGAGSADAELRLDLDDDAIANQQRGAGGNGQGADALPASGSDDRAGPSRGRRGGHDDTSSHDFDGSPYGRNGTYSGRLRDRGTPRIETGHNAPPLVSPLTKKKSKPRKRLSTSTPGPDRSGKRAKSSNIQALTIVDDIKNQTLDILETEDDPVTCVTRVHETSLQVLEEAERGQVCYHALQTTRQWLDRISPSDRKRCMKLLRDMVGGGAR